MTLQENGLLLQRRSSLFQELAHRNGAGGLLDPGEKWSNDKLLNGSQTVVTRQGLLTAVAGLVLLAVCTWLLLPMGNDDSQPSSSISTGLNLAMINNCRKQVAKSSQRSACSSICSEAKSILPYPKTHKTCIAGCELGWNKARDKGCALSSHQEQIKCVNDVIEVCGDTFCKKYENMVPKPLLYNQCISACKKAATKGCNEGASQVRELMSRLTNEL